MQRSVNHPVDLLALHEKNPGRYPFLLQSVAHGTPQARYDILFAFPGDSISLTSEGLTATFPLEDESSFLEALDTWYSREQDTRGPTHTSSTNPSFSGGWFLYLGYELASEIEPILDLPLPPPGQPIAHACRTPAAMIFDHETSCVHLVAEPGRQPLLDQMQADLLHANKTTDQSPGIHAANILEDDPQLYLDGVDRIRQYIIEGDVFQVNLSRAWEIVVSPEVRQTDIYRALRQHNPAPFAGIANIPGLTIISSSPERLIKVSGTEIQTRPIAGTRPRSRVKDTDQAFSSELMTHPKENAEHVMLIDLERNDLGRVCVPGSVEVNEKMVLESYAHVHHIVSNIRGKLQKQVTPGKMIRAVFPGGTITGCPKVRCMEIIAELEQTHRGAYTGSMGYLNLNGDMDLNILIRTITVTRNKIQLRAGAGIVADSVPQQELQETRAKAKGMLLALGIENL